MGQRAREVIDLAARGLDVRRDLADALADAVLGCDLVRLAEAVRAGGPHEARRVLELAEALATLVNEDNLAACGEDAL